MLPIVEEATLHTLALCSDATCVPVGKVSSDQAVLSTPTFHLVEVDVTEVMEEQDWADRLLHAEVEGEGLQPFLIERFADEDGRGEVRLDPEVEAAYGGILETMGYFLLKEEEEAEFALDVGEEEWGEDWELEEWGEEWELEEGGEEWGGGEYSDSPEPPPEL